MELTDLPLECQQLILDKITHKATLLNVHQVNKLWNKLAASSRVICRDVQLPALYDTRTQWGYVARWTRERAGLCEYMRILAFPSKDKDNPLSHVIIDTDERQVAEGRLFEVLQHAAPSVRRLCVHAYGHLYNLEFGAAFLLGPALPLFSNLRDIEAYWSGDGLSRTHLNCLQCSPLLERIRVRYSGNVDLGPHFPEGLFQLRHLSCLGLAVSSDRCLNGQLTSFCTVPDGLSQLSALTNLSLTRYYDRVDNSALVHLTSLQHLSLSENPTKHRDDGEWVHNLPPFLKSLSVSGNDSIIGGRERPRPPSTRKTRVWTVPCITGLSQLTCVSFKHIRGFRVHEWDRMSCLARLSSLCALELSACGLSVVPDAVVGLSSLRWLTLGSNKLERLPAGAYLRHLQMLVLVDNNFSSVPLEAVAAATALTRLDMGGNPLVWTAPQAEAVKHIKSFRYPC